MQVLFITEYANRDVGAGLGFGTVHFRLRRNRSNQFPILAYATDA